MACTTSKHPNVLIAYTRLDKAMACNVSLGTIHARSFIPGSTDPKHN